MDEPKEYINKKTIFLGREFYVDSRTHIPRPATEFITKHYVNSINGYKHKIVVAEIGVGSGVISISAALECPNISRIYAIDLYKEALEVASINVAAYKLQSKVELLQGDLFTPILDKNVDLIIANLPFASDKKMRSLRPEVLEFEPICGIYGEKTGFELYERMFSQLKECKYLHSIKGLWVYCYKEHITRVRDIKESMFPSYDLELIEDADKPNYLHCFLHKEQTQP